MASASGKHSALAPGHRLDGYELLWPVGEGGMASVWVARLLRKHGFEKLVAIKTILPKFANDESFQTMFLDEARIASRIDHANVAHIHDLGESEVDEILYLVMEYVDGDALTRLRKMLIKRNVEFPVGIALRIMADVSAGLHAAHELKGVDGSPLGVVHRDVSPQNILITTEGVSKLIDFGVAKAAGRLTEETHTGYVKGKVQYMAPEQALGRPVDRRADLWAVGAVIYHLVANRPPFEADNQLALLNMLQRGRPPAPLPATIPPAVSEIVRRALTHNPKERFQTALEMRVAIEKTGLAASIEEVGAFVQLHLGEVAGRRRAAIASALQAAEQRATGGTMPGHGSPGHPHHHQSSQAMHASTQRIDPLDASSFAPTSTPVFRAGQVGASSERIGPPTPQSFPASFSTTSTLQGPPPPPPPPPPAQHQAGLEPGSDPRLTTPLSAPVLPPFATNSPPNQLLAPSVEWTVGPRSSQPNIAAPPPMGATEPLPALADTLEGNTDITNTNPGGSLGLGSISASVNTRPQRGVPWLAIVGVSLLSAALAVAVGFGLKNRVAAKQFEPQFSPLPGTTTTIPSAEPIAPSDPSAEAPSATPAAPATSAAEPALTPSASTSTSASASASATASASASGTPTTRPFVRPAPAGSGKKKPKVDDGF